MGFWLSWDVEDNVKMQVFADNAAAANKESHSPGLKECPVQVRHGAKRKLEEEETEEAFKMPHLDSGGGIDSGGGGAKSPKSNREYIESRQSVFDTSIEKLTSYRQTPDPSLRRSVLICNTLRTLEREMVSEGFSPSPPVTLLPPIETDKMTLDPLPGSSSAMECYSSSSASTISPPSSLVLYFGGGNGGSNGGSSSGGVGGSLVTAVEPVPCREAEMRFEKNLTDLDAVSGRTTPYPPPPPTPAPSLSTNNTSLLDLNPGRTMWDSAHENSSSSSSSSSSVSSSPASAGSERASTTISWSSLLSFPSQSELVTTSLNGHDDEWPANNSVYEADINCGPEGSNGSSAGGGPNTSPSASSDSGISTASDEIFGDIDLSLYDFDLLPLSPPNNRAAPPSAEELLRSFPPQFAGGPSIQLASPAVNSASSFINSASSFSIHTPRHTRSYESMCEDYDHCMMPAPP